MGVGRALSTGFVEHGVGPWKLTGMASRALARSRSVCSHLSARSSSPMPCLPSPSLPAGLRSALLSVLSLSPPRTLGLARACAFALCLLPPIRAFVLTCALPSAPSLRAGLRSALLSVLSPPCTLGASQLSRTLGVLFLASARGARSGASEKACVDGARHQRRAPFEIAPGPP